MTVMDMQCGYSILKVQFVRYGQYFRKDIQTMNQHYQQNAKTEQC